MSNPLSRVFQRQSLRGNVRRALESGVGLYHASWDIESAMTASASSDLAEELTAWCRDILSQMNRPYGLDYVTLALAVLGEKEGQVASTNYGVLRPQDFYGQGPAETQIHTTLSHWTDTEIFARSRGGRLSAVLFSWGDLTRELLLTG